MDNYKMISELFSIYLKDTEEYAPQEMMKDEELTKEIASMVREDKQFEFDSAISDFSYLLEKRGFIAGFKVAHRLMSEVMKK